MVEEDRLPSKEIPALLMPISLKEGKEGFSHLLRLFVYDACFDVSLLSKSI